MRGGTTMSFEYRELTTQVFLNAGKDKPECSPCNTCGTTTLDTQSDGCDEDDDLECSPCNTCGTTTLDTDSVGCDKDDDDPGRGKGKGGDRQALGLLRQQLRDTLAAG